jgi:hypothetical protein
MGFEIFIYILLRWVTKLIGKICDLPPAHPSSYFMPSPLLCTYQYLSRGVRVREMGGDLTKKFKNGSNARWWGILK